MHILFLSLYIDSLFVFGLYFIHDFYLEQLSTTTYEQRKNNSYAPLYLFVITSTLENKTKKKIKKI